MSMCVFLYVEPVSRSKDYVRPRIKIGLVVCLYTPVSPSVLELEGRLYNTRSILFFLFLRMNLWGSLHTLCLLACQMELPQAIQVFVVVSLACRVLLLPFVS